MDNIKALPKIARTVHETCLCLHLQRAARAVGRRYDDALRPVGLTNQQFSLLMSLARPDAPSIGSLAEELVMDRTNLTACLKPLERRGLLAVKVAEGDRRSRVLFLSKAGRQLLNDALPLWRKAQAQVAKDASPSRVKAMRSDLRTLKLDSL